MILRARARSLAMRTNRQLTVSETFSSSSSSSSDLHQCAHSAASQRGRSVDGIMRVDKIDDVRDELEWPSFARRRRALARSLCFADWRLRVARFERRASSVELRLLAAVQLPQR